MSEVKLSEATTHQSASTVIEQMQSLGHEHVLFCNDQATGLKAIIAVHNTTLGPSLGGTRMWSYATEAEALTDVLRLSRGMTYKSSLAGLNLGGGKAVIIGDSRTQKSEAMFRRFGKFVNSLGGKYITAEDVGITTRDIEWVKMETDHVAGLPEYRGGSGDPSPVTAYGVYMGMKAAAKAQFGSDSLAGRKVAVQGVGNVGRHLVDHLVKEGALVTITDIFDDNIKKVTDKHSVNVVAADAIYGVDMDIYAPCALGATVNDQTLAQLKCSIVCGAANNQLKNEAVHGEVLRERGILYAPDYLVNAGGIINCYWEVIGYNRDAALSQAEGIYATTENVLKESAAKGRPTYQIANEMAEARINAVAATKIPM
jgi:leucine dehydrogenase